LVGAHFQDHLGGKIAKVRVLNEMRFRNFFENAVVSGLKIQPKLRFTPECRLSVATGVSGFFNFESKLTERLQNIKFLVRTLKSGVAYSKLNTLPRDIWAVGLSLFPLAIRYIRDRRILAFFDKALEFHVQAEQLPLVESKIRLMDEGCMPDGLFRATVNWKIASSEIESIRRFAIRADDYLQKWGIATLEIDDRVMHEDGSMLAVLGDTYHQCGGMCMSSSATSGVVDHDGRVWGTKNVFIAGASIFPTSSHSNCTLTALALTARLASRIRRFA
jgi:hypothetical protein